MKPIHWLYIGTIAERVRDMLSHSHLAVTVMYGQIGEPNVTFDVIAGKHRVAYALHGLPSEFDRQHGPNCVGPLNDMANAAARYHAEEVATGLQRKIAEGLQKEAAGRKPT